MNCLRFDYKTCCRICTENSSETHNLFETRHRATTLSEMMSFCTQLALQENDSSRPSNICRPCIENLRTAYYFCKLAKASEEKFREFYLSQQSVTIFAEPVESNLGKKGECENIDGEANFENSQSLTTIDEYSKIKIEDSDDETINMNQKPKRGGSIKPYGNSEVLRRKDIKWQCYKCQVDMPFLEFLRIHMKGHNDGTPHECTVCGLHFSKRRFDRHLCMGESVPCEYCAETFNSTVKLLEHLEMHKNDLEISRCKLCRKNLPMKKLHEFHLHHHHKAKPNICPFCNKRFNTRSGMTVHTNVNHRPAAAKCILIELKIFVPNIN